MVDYIKRSFSGELHMYKYLFVLLLSFCLCGTADAQNAGTGEKAAALNYTKINSDLDALSKKLSSGKVSAKETGEYLQKINQIQDSVNLARQQSNDDLESTRKKLNALGPAPEKDEKEPAAIARQREEFNKTADMLKTAVAQADLTKTKIEDLNNLILKIRNQELLNNILTKQSSIFHPEEFAKSLVSFSGFLFEIIKSPFTWYKSLSTEDQEKVNSNIVYVIVVMLAALAAAVYLSLYIRKWFGYQSGIERPDYSQKVRAALWMTVARGVIPAAIIGAFLFWQKNNQIINNGSFGILLHTAAVYLLYYYLIKALVRVIFTPSNSKWRIIEVCDEKAQSTSRALIFSTAAICIVSFFQSMAGQMDYNQDIIYSLKIFANAVKAFCIIITARKFLYDSKSLTDEEIKDGNNIGDLSTSSKVSLFISFLMAAAFALSLLGYIRLSEFIINRFIISVTVIGIFYIFDKLLRVVFHRILLFKFWITTFRINRRTLVKTEFWFGFFLTPVLGILCLIVLLAVWGVAVDIMLAQIKNFLTGFNIGGVRISITSILLGIISFFVSMFLFKMLKNSFNSGNLSKIDMDPGVRNSLVSAIGFIGLIFSAVLAIAVMGGSFSSIAIIAGALSFGAGLGLQNMVSNLVAGLTILFERPVKIGDWVIIDGQEGIVKKINMRSTELETWNKSNVIIPNSDILSKSLINKTYSDLMSRVEIKVGVDYDSDINLVKNILLDIAKNDPEVLTSPPPSLSFTDLGDSSLNFQLNCFTANVYSASGIAFRIRENIVNKFRENNINIPFPQRVIHCFPEAAATPFVHQDGQLSAAKDSARRIGTKPEAESRAHPDEQQLATNSSSR